jgi:hypothetical protein
MCIVEGIHRFTRYLGVFGGIILQTGQSLSSGHSLSPTTSEAQVGGKLGGPCAPDD